MKLLIAVAAALIVGLFGWFGVPVERETVEEFLEENVSSYRVQDEQSSVTVAGKVKEVIDGDTLVVEVGGEAITIRVIGIDTPEVAGSPAGAECYGGNASERARVLLTDQSVAVTTDPTQDRYDQYDRLLGYVTVGERDFGIIMIEEGYAREFTYRDPYEKQAQYQTLESQAQAQEVGLWGMCT